MVNLVEKAYLIEDAIQQLDLLILRMHKAGLSYRDLIKIVLWRLEDLLPQFEAETELKKK